jgi:metal-sulfur cluster biosynthetic enzyme
MQDAEYYIPANEWDFLESPGPAWEGWCFTKGIDLTNPLAVARKYTPIEVDVDFRADQVTHLADEVRVAAVEPDGSLREVPSQVYGDHAEDDVRRCRLFFLADFDPKATKAFRILYGNPAPSAPTWTTDLQVSGEAWALDIENQYYRIELARSMGQLKSIVYKNSGLLLGKGRSAEGAYGGHGVEGSIHHNPDWSDEFTGRYRLTSWTEPPNHEVIRGPVCVRTTRWGHPILALGPGVGQTRKVVARSTYTFWAHQPYFTLESRLEVLEDVRWSDCRNDEWVGIGRDLPEVAWSMDNEQIGHGEMHWSRQDPAWLTVYSGATGDGFASIRLAYECTHPDWHEPDTVAINDQWGGLWVRYPLRNALMRAGDYVHEKNAYLLHRFEPHNGHGFDILTGYTEALKSSPKQEEPATPRARPLSVANVRDALRCCFDTEIYIKGSPFSRRRLSYLDLGWIRDVRIEGVNVQIDLVLPYAGREASLTRFFENIQSQVRGLVGGVGEVLVRHVREPAWTQDDMTCKGRREMGLEAQGSDI